MQEQLAKIKKDFLKAMAEVKDILQLEELEQRFFSRRSGELTQAMKNLKDLSVEARQEFGKLANEVKHELEEVFAKKREQIETAKMGDVLEREIIDVTQPKLPEKEVGHLHPNTLVQNDLEDLFTSMGFMVLDGLELESEYYNFTTLNMPSDDPARDTQDTFYIKGHSDWVMRTQTSSMQVRALEKYGAPIRMVVPGRCFRNEATDAAHEHTFCQLEGLVVDKNISVSHLIGVMKELLRGVFKRDVETRLRPGHFQFVEPGFELDIKCLICGGVGCGACKHSGWIETMPCGLVHPKVLAYGGLDPKEWTGFAFGLGMTRLVMQKYCIDDIRHLQGGDLRFLKQF
ncbi:MAG: phenylalanine--tRNA ligase subunit alpha [Candidatus Magasanikbacteria bacterium]|nr:phenylalanine--tRNA ligase subunit alpha [Candidatus Magasanikbacteria bacterium]